MDAKNQAERKALEGLLRELEHRVFIQYPQRERFVFFFISCFTFHWWLPITNQFSLFRMCFVCVVVQVRLCVWPMAIRFLVRAVLVFLAFFVFLSYCRIGGVWYIWKLVLVRTVFVCLLFWPLFWFFVVYQVRRCDRWEPVSCPLLFFSFLRFFLRVGCVGPQSSGNRFRILTPPFFSSFFLFSS